MRAPQKVRRIEDKIIILSQNLSNETEEAIKFIFTPVSKAIPCNSKVSINILKNDYYFSLEGIVTNGRKYVSASSQKEPILIAAKIVADELLVKINHLHIQIGLQQDI